MKALQDANQTLSVENAKLVGHQNHNQKIQYHLNIKQENIRLKEVSMMESASSPTSMAPGLVGVGGRLFTPPAGNTPPRNRLFPLDAQHRCLTVFGQGDSDHQDDYLFNAI